MSKFKNKLKEFITEHESPIFMNTEYEYFDISDETIASEIQAVGVQSGMQFLAYDEGVASFSTYQKRAIEVFCDSLDKNDYVDFYDISAVVTDPTTHLSKATTDFDFETTRESECIEFFIDIAIKSDYVTYNPTYVNPNDPTDYSDSEVFIVPIGSENNTEYDELNPNVDTPLVATLTSTKSASEYGKYLVSVHPKDEDSILIQINYSKVPNEDDVLQDLDSLNNMDFGEYTNDFELVKSAKYNEDELSTTTAIYRSITKLDVLNIVEGFDEIITNNALYEFKRVIKVNSRATKRIKMQCQKGFKYDPNRMTCVKISGSELAKSRISHRQMSRTKKSLGQSFKTRVLIKTRKAKRFRKLMGL